MLKLRDTAGNFRFELEGGDKALAQKLLQRCVRADWFSELDKSDSFRLRVAQGRREQLSLDLAQLATHVKVSWQDQRLFEGMLLEAHTAEDGSLELVYRDRLFALERQVDGSHFKNDSLANVLKALVGRVGLDAKLLGDFGEKLPGIFLGAKTLFENLVFLADSFGFFFYLHGPSNVVHFMRLGSTSARHKIDARRDAVALQLQARSDLRWSSVEARVFDDRSLASESRRFSGSALYGALSSLSRHAGSRAKESWPFAPGEYDVHAQNAADYDDAERRIRHPLAKKAVFQESLRLRAYAPLALPGDEVEVANAGASQNGTFLLHRCHVKFASARPSIELNLVRP